MFLSLRHNTAVCALLFAKDTRTGASRERDLFHIREAMIRNREHGTRDEIKYWMDTGDFKSLKGIDRAISSAVA